MCYTYGYSFILKDINRDHLNEETQRVRSERALSAGLPRPLPVGFRVRHLPTTLYSPITKLHNAQCPEFSLGFITWVWLIESLAMWWNSISSPLLSLRLGWLQAPTLWSMAGLSGDQSPIWVFSSLSINSGVTQGLMNNNDTSVTWEFPGF